MDMYFQNTPVWAVEGNVPFKNSSFVTFNQPKPEQRGMIAAATRLGARHPNYVCLLMRGKLFAKLKYLF